MKNNKQLIKDIEEIVSEWYHRWVKYGYYGSPDKPLSEDTEFNQATEAVLALFDSHLKAGKVELLEELEKEAIKRKVISSKMLSIYDETFVPLSIIKEKKKESKK
jgi:hypothetical protein